MNAYVLHGIGDLRYKEVENPKPSRGEALIRVGAVGICGSDIPRIYETGAHRHPLIPGHEFAGEVVGLGAGADDKWQGKKVGVFPLIPCQRCIPCKNRQYELCQNYNYLGSRTDGGFAEYVAVPCDNLLALPANVSMEAAAMLEPMAVAVHAIRRLFSVSGIKDEAERINKPIVVWGLGTIGLFVTMFLVQMGMKHILVVGNKEFQRQRAKELGIAESDYCDAGTLDVVSWIREKTDGNGAGLLLECVGKNETITSVINAAAPSAGIVMLGNPHSSMSFDKQTYWKILRSQLKITGTWNSSFIHEESDDWHYVGKLLAEGKIEPEKLISHRFMLKELERGLEIMRDKTEDYVKVMVVM